MDTMRWKLPLKSTRQAASDKLFAPPGHFYSPIVAVEEVDRPALEAAYARDPAEIDMNYPGQLAMLRRLAAHFSAFPPHGAGSAARFRAPNAQFSLGDAKLLAAFIAEFRPRHIIEVGSGHSSAVILDTMERLGVSPECTLVEPYTERLRSLLRPGDLERVRLIEEKVQAVDLALFDTLGEDDILFLDTSHVGKTGSDVLHEIFAVLPRLKPGVLVHFHDVFVGFEYPLPWVVEENRSWNEIYLLRAYLANNPKWRIELHANSLEPRFPGKFREIAPGYSVDGASLWLRKMG